MQLTVDKIIRSRRRSLCLELSEEGEIILRAPNRISNREIEQFIFEKKSWVLKRRQEQQQNRVWLLPENYSEYEYFPYLGCEYKLNFGNNLSQSLYFDDGFWLENRYINKAPQLFRNWYRKRAEEIFSQLIDKYVTIHSLNYGMLNITAGKKTLGSCNINGNINLSWRLIMFPLEVIEYIVVHELAHLKHHNHSRAFWNQVAKMLPDYKIHKRWLRLNSLC